jgi:hypothetical protein
MALWEAGQGRPSTERALSLLSAATPERTRHELAALPIGERDARLLTLREWTFGRTLASVADCVACGERLELRFTVDDLRLPHEVRGESFVVRLDDYEVEFRLPDSTDLAEVAVGSGGRRKLLSRCVRAARKGARSRPFNRLPARVLDAVAERMGEVDPQADIHTELRCPECEHAWTATFDIVAFFWLELERWARRTLREVHVLASAYGWREPDILALSPWRRALYLEMAQP